MPPLSLPDFASLFQQSARLLTLRLEGLAGEDLLPHTLQGEEGLSRLYRHALVCLSPDAGLELKSLLGRAARLGILSADGAERVICGLVTAAEYLGSDGGFARYGLTIEPALALLALRRTSRVFQDLSVPDIVQQVLEEHQADNPAFTSTFQFSAETRLSYAPRSYCLQYRESDLDFITRLLAEEGISYTFRFDDSGETPIHTLVLFDDVWSLPACSQAAVRFHRNDATEQADGVTAWQSVRRLQSGRTSLASFDYQPVSTVQAGEAHLQNHGEQGNAALATLEDYDPQTLYFGRDADDLARYAQLRQQAHDLTAKAFTGVGAVRQLGAGQWFRLDEHPAHAGDLADAREFIVLSQTLTARNNLPDELNRQRSAPSPSTESSPLFENRFTAVRRGVAVVPGVSAEARDSTVAGNGDFAGNGLMPLAVPFRAKPTALGIQTATVVGPAEEEIHTDSQGRIKVQFHWQRPSEHPEFGANLDDKSSCWLRVAYPSAGVAWGQQFIPRIGQEVLVDFIEGDIDRPVVVGVLYNGSHPTPDFSGAGKLPANKTLSGIKSKEYKGSQYNELLLDDSTGEVRTKLSSEHAKTQLNQGYLIHPRTEGKGEPRGEGFELRTDKHGALRAAHGILLSTEAQNGASGKQLDRVQAQSQLDSAFTLAQSLAEVATHQQADTAETGQDDQTVQSDNSAGPKTKQGHLHHLQHALKSWEAGSNTDKEGQSASQQQTGQQPLIVLSAPAGIVSTTAQAQALTAGTNLDLIAQRDTHQTSGRRWIHNAGQHISLFVQGVKEQISLKLIAARGKIQMQAQDDSIEMNAAKDIKQTANQKVHVMAGEEILLASGGGYIRLRGGDIEVHCPGKISIKGAAHIIDGPERMNVGHPDFPQGSMKTPLTVQLDQSPLGLQLGWARMPYQLFADGALVQQGVLDQSAQLQIAHEVVTQQYLLKLANGVEYQIPVATDYTNPEQGELANKGFHKHLAGAAPEGGATEASAVARTDHYQTLTGKLAEGEQA